MPRLSFPRVEFNRKRVFRLRQASPPRRPRSSVLFMSYDWLLQNLDIRKSDRYGEIVALKSSKAVLAGADYSL